MKDMFYVRTILFIGVIAVAGYAGYGWNKANGRIAELNSKLSDANAAFGRFANDVWHDKIISETTYKAQKELLTDLNSLFGKKPGPTVEDIVSRLKKYPWAACVDGPCEPIGMCCDGVNYPGFILGPQPTELCVCWTFSIVDAQGNPVTCQDSTVYPYDCTTYGYNLAKLRACGPGLGIKRTCGSHTYTYYPPY